MERMRVSRDGERERGLWLERGARALALGYDEAGARKRYGCESTKGTGF
jgi:hypothetical protein